MKVLKVFGLMSAFCIAVSCNDTNAIYAEIPVNDAVDAPPVSGQFNKRVLLEDYTGAWCGNCTRVAYGIEQVQLATDKSVVVAIHNGPNGTDPYHYADFQPLKDMISPLYDLELPQARLNRTITWVEPDSNIQEAVNLTSDNCGLGIAMTSTVANGQIALNVNVKFAQNYSNLKLVVYVLENGLIYRQTNYTSYYGGQHFINDFVHNHVLRSSLTNLLGDPINGSEFDHTFTRNFTMSVPPNVANAENISFVAIVTDTNNNAINSRAAAPNEDQAFEQNP